MSVKYWYFNSHLCEWNHECKPRHLNEQNSLHRKHKLNEKKQKTINYYLTVSFISVFLCHDSDVYFREK